MNGNSTTFTGNRRPLALLLVVAAALLVIVLRLIPYGVRGVNFAPVGAMLLFAGARLSPRFFMPVVLLPLVATDLYFYAVKGWPFPLFSYASYCVYLMLGYLLLRRTESPIRIGSLTIAASVQFFLITNFGVWLSHVIRPEQYLGAPFQFAPTLGGLLNCYEVALPFFRGTFVSDILFSAVFFGVHAVLVRKYHPAEKPIETEERS